MKLKTPQKVKKINKKINLTKTIKIIPVRFTETILYLEDVFKLELSREEGVEDLEMDNNNEYTR